MGVTGLLPLLEAAQKPFHIREFAKCSVAVDMYVWLHRGAYGCAKALCSGEDTTAYIDYCLERVGLLLHFGVRPYLVFDGAPLPAKAAEEEERRSRRQSAIQVARQASESGDFASARKHYARAVNVTTEMAARVIYAVKERHADKVDILVAPYEADAQIAFLCRSGLCQAAISDDSDLIPYGVPVLLTKMDHSGEGKRLEQEDVLNKMMKPAKGKPVDLRGWGRQELVLMCVTAGCDYISSLPGYGIRKAYELVKRFRRMDRVLRTLEYRARAAKSCLPDGYKEAFRTAVLTYGHQTVFDPSTKRLRHLSPLEVSEDFDVSFLGALPKTEEENALVEQVARGEVCPYTKTAFVFIKRKEVTLEAQQTKLQRDNPWKKAARPLQERSASSDNVPRNRSTTGMEQFARKAAQTEQPRSLQNPHGSQLRKPRFFLAQSGLRRSKQSSQKTKVKSIGATITTFFSRLLKNDTAEETSRASPERIATENRNLSSSTHIAEMSSGSSHQAANKETQEAQKEKALQEMNTRASMALESGTGCQHENRRSSTSSSSRFFGSHTPKYEIVEDNAKEKSTASPESQNSATQKLFAAEQSTPVAERVAHEIVDFAIFERKQNDSAFAAKRPTSGLESQRPTKSRKVQKPKSEWQCERCTLLNGPWKRKCAACGHEKPKTPVQSWSRGSRKSPRLAKAMSFSASSTPRERGVRRLDVSGASVGTASSKSSTENSFVAFAYSCGADESLLSPPRYTTSLSPPGTASRAVEQVQFA